MKILIIGDSFSANNDGWPSMLGHHVVNKSENGIGEYKIFAKSKNSMSFDKIIFNHTSPWRIHTRLHPIHKNNPERNNNDFLLNDVEYHSKINKDMKIVDEYLKKYYDPEYQQDMYNLLLKEIMNIPNSVHITFHDPDDTKMIKNNFNHIWKKCPGDINHMSIEGNQLVAEKIKKLI
jgi:hypothetical protein